MVFERQDVVKYLELFLESIGFLFMLFYFVKGFVCGIVMWVQYMFFIGVVVGFDGLNQGIFVVFNLDVDMIMECLKFVFEVYGIQFFLF